MNSLRRLSTFTCLASLFAVALASLPAIDLVDDFDGANLDPDVWESTGDKTVSTEGGKLLWANDGGNWASGDISSLQSFFLPPEGETTVIEWTLGSGEITTANPNGGQSIRMQIGIHSANETSARKEHWNNTTGGVWIDLDNIRPDDTATASGGMFYSNDAKQNNSNGVNIGSVTLNWNWETENKVIRLEITQTEFHWFDGETNLGGGFWEDSEIDSEFANGFRVLALGMNFDGGRGSTSVERIAVTNGALPASLITSFGASSLSAKSGHTVELNWRVDPDAAVSIDRGIGDVNAQTTDGVGAIEVVIPDVAEPTALDYTLTATRDGEEESRVLTLNIAPAEKVVLGAFKDEFEGDELDPERWEHRGERTYTVADGKVSWDANAADWGHGELNSLNLFLVPEPGDSKTITWTLGPADASAEDAEGNSLRPMVGIFSANEQHDWSRQHWQNTTGGIWLDITAMGNSRPDGVSGDLIHANDTKAVNSNGVQLTNFDVPDWNWKTDNHQFSLFLTNKDYSWFSGDILLGTGTWADAGIDDEFAGGFKIMMMAGNFNQGRGPMSLEAIEVENAPLEDPNLAVTANNLFGTLESNSGVVEREISLRNSGPSKTLTIASATVTGRDHDLFTLGEVPTELAPGERVVIPVTLDPGNREGALIAQIELDTNDEGGAPIIVDLTARVEKANGLLVHYQMDETDGETMIDASGNDFHGAYRTANGGSFTLGQSGLAGGTAVRLDDAGGDGAAFGELDRDSNLPPLDSLTISLWVKIDPAEAGGSGVLFSKGDTVGDPFAAVAGIAADAASPFQWYAGGSESITTAPALEVDKVHHVVVSHTDTDGSELDADRTVIYVDNVIVGEMAPAEGFRENRHSSLQIGAFVGTLGLNGIIDDFQLYSRAYDAEDIAFLFNNPGNVIGQETENEPATPALTQVGLSGEGSLQFTVPQGVTVDIEYSEDLQSWELIATDVSGVFQDADAGRNAKPTGYYRAAQP